MRDRSAILPRALVASVVLVAVSGCLPRDPDSPGENLLKPPRVASGSADLDIFFITLPDQAAEMAFEQVWSQADAQQIGAETRQRQIANGLQAGVLGWRLPPEIQRMIEERSQPLPGAAAPVDPTALPDNLMQQADLEKMDRVSIRRIAVPPKKRFEIIVSRVFPRLPLLLKTGGNITGGDYEESQGIFGVRATAVSGGKVRLQIDPELQYGQPERQISGDAVSVWKMVHTRKKVPLDMLSMACDLSPGEFLAIGTYPGMPGSVGDRFFEDHTMGEPCRKLLLIRVARAPGNELFGELPRGD